MRNRDVSEYTAEGGGISVRGQSKCPEDIEFLPKGLS